MYTEQQYKNSLCHHGIKGQRWGLRRFQNEDGSYTAAGKNRYGFDTSTTKNLSFGNKMLRYNAQRTANRLNKMSSDRKARMSYRQRQSYNAAKEYWNARAVGKTPTRDRGLIKRTYDMYRAKNAGQRAGVTAANALYSNIVTASARRALGQDISIKSIATSTATTTGMNMVTDEMLARIFGHY